MMRARPSHLSGLALRLGAMLAVTFFTACGDGTTEPPPDPPRATTITVSPATADLAALGATVQLTAEVRDQNGQAMAGAAVTWASSAAAVATVNESGLVTAVANGSATITATAGSASGSAAVTVAQEVSAVAVLPDTATVVEGDTLRLAATATDANGQAVAGVEFVWASGDTAVAVVDASGLVTGVGAGQAEMSATTAGIAGRAQLTVAAPAPTAIAVTPDTVELTALGQTRRLTAEVRDQLGRVMENQPVVWASTDAMVATVDSTGLVTAAGNGTAAISATAGSASDTAVVSVRQAVRSATVSPAADTVTLGDTLRLVAEAYDENGHVVQGAAFTWSSSNVAVAWADPSGLVWGAAEGTAAITATAGDASGTSEITVVSPDRPALVALYEATDGPNWVNNDNWLTDAPLEDWYGVETDGDGRVVNIGLGGTWDTDAQEWVLHGLAGPIPTELGDLTELRELLLDHNELGGGIPRELGRLTNLHKLNLETNNLYGPIPSELGTLSSLEDLRLGENHLSGPIPPELGNLADLWYLSLYVNRLTGPIPTELGNLSSLAVMELGENQLAGPIPTELGNLSNLSLLHLDNNDLTGPIPAELGSLADLSSLYLNLNRLTGPLPPEFGNLANLESLRLSDNSKLAGALPLSLASLSALEEFWYNGTGLYAPDDESFRAWLNAIPDHQGNAADAQIIGQVSIEGTGIDGVTVNLSNGNSTTTSGGGSYRFDDVEVGAYTVTISNYPSDAVFDATSVAVTISSAGQSVKADFFGSYIRVASILVSVTVDNVELSGVTVRLSGTADATATTDNSGGVAFTGLRMGMYSVEISGYDTDEYEFAITSKDVTVGVGEVVDVVFEGV
ncbi:MAG: Ig-like domain-containing protein, partial [Gammaproteobacteria bacterium]|nr:Ig-like domain-containing protein [Gammaproteobacteria bacterium]